MQQNELTLTKTIYAKRKPFTKKEFNDVMHLEINTHLTAHPHLVFHKLGDSVKHPDRSQTYTIHFIPKSNFPNLSTK